MPREKKNIETLYCHLDKEVSQDVKKICEKSGLTKTKVVERALEMYIERYNKTGKT